MANSSEVNSGREILKPYKTKLTPEQLEMQNYFRKRAFAVPNKKGKGSYKRKKNHEDIEA